MNDYCPLLLAIFLCGGWVVAPKAEKALRKKDKCELNWKEKVVSLLGIPAYLGPITVSGLADARVAQLGYFLIGIAYGFALEARVTRECSSVDRVRVSGN